MSSMVTTSTVAVVSSMATSEVAATFSLIAIALLGVLLVGREVVNFGQGVATRRLARGIDIATFPLLLAFVVIMAIKMSESMAQ